MRSSAPPRSERSRDVTERPGRPGRFRFRPRDVVRRYNAGARRIGRQKGGTGLHLWDAHVRELVEALKAFEPSALPRFIQPGVNVPMVVAMVLPLLEPPLREALLEHGADPNEAMHYPLSLDVQGPLGGPRNVRESFSTGATALDILERAEELLAERDAAGPPVRPKRRSRIARTTAFRRRRSRSGPSAR